MLRASPLLPPTSLELSSPYPSPAQSMRGRETPWLLSCYSPDWNGHNLSLKQPCFNNSKQNKIPTRIKTLQNKMPTRIKTLLNECPSTFFTVLSGTSSQCKFNSKILCCQIKPSRKSGFTLGKFKQGWEGGWREFERIPVRLHKKGRRSGAFWT